MSVLRVASYNCENLFSRAKPLALLDRDKAREILEAITALEALLKKGNYSANDKRDIARMAKDLDAYILIREDRGKLFTGTGSNRRVTAAGKSSWDGAIEFKRTRFDQDERKSTADVIKALNADLLCLVEVEDRTSILSFNRHALTPAARFKFGMLIDGNDDRGIDLGVFSNFPIVSIQPHVYDTDSVGEVFSRDCPEYVIEGPDGVPLVLLCNHLKSKGFGSPASSDAKRKRQAEQIRKILGKYDLSAERVIVAGDMNDVPGSVPLQPLLSVPHLSDVLELQFGADMGMRWTYKYGSQLNQIDYILVSDPLKNAFRAAGVERRGIYKIENTTGEIGFPSVTSHSTAASDHGGVWAEFSL